MPKRIPIAEAKRVAEAQDCRQVILLAWDGERTHVVTYGVTKDDCDQAAYGGRKIAKLLNLTDAVEPMNTEFTCPHECVPGDVHHACDLHNG